MDEISTARVTLQTLVHFPHCLISAATFIAKKRNRGGGFGPQRETGERERAIYAKGRGTLTEHKNRGF